MELAHAMEDMHQLVQQYAPDRWRRPESRELRGKFAGYIKAAQEMQDCTTKAEANHRIEAMIRIWETFRKGGIHSDYEAGALHAYQGALAVLKRKGKDHTLLDARQVILNRIEALQQAIVEDLEDDDPDDNSSNL